MKKILLILSVALLAISSNAQKLKILSMEALGGDKSEGVNKIHSTITYDDTFSLNLVTNSNTSDLPLNCPPNDGLASYSYRIYSKTNGQYVQTKCMKESDSLGRIIVQYYPQSNGDVIYLGAYQGNTAIERRDANDNPVWIKHYGSSWGGEGVNSVAVAQDGGFFILTASLGNDGDVGMHYGSAFEADIWVLRVDNDGEMLWGKVLGGTGRDIATEIYASEDGGCYVIGLTGSNDHDAVGYKGAGDVFVARLDSLGNKEWSKCYGGSGAEADYTSAIFAEPDGWGGFYILSRTDSDDGDVQNKTDKSPDYWLLHIDKDGNILWENNYGSGLAEYPAAFCRGANGNLWLGGSGGGIPDTVMGDVLEGFGGADVWIVQVDTNGNIINQRTLGTNQRDELIALYPVDDGTVIAAGQYVQDESPSGKHSPGFPLTSQGGSEIFIAHLSPDTDLSIIDPKNRVPDWQVYPNPTDGNITIKVNGGGKRHSVAVADIQGKVLHTAALKNNKLDIDTRAWANGTYTITLSDSQGNTATKKVTTTNIIQL